MKIALVHDWLVNLSGAERVLLELHKMFPEAPVYTLFADKKFVRRYFSDVYVRPSFLQLIPGITKLYQKFLFLMPVAIESFDLSDYDIVISSSAVFSKGLVLKPKARHICYCYSPTRQIWDLHSDYVTRSLIYRIAQHILRLWDRHASDRVDEFVAISEHVRQRIRKYYRRSATVIYPPISNFQSNSNGPMSKNSEIKTFNKNFTFVPSSGRGKLKIKNLGNYYLIVSRLYKHKNIDIAIEAFAKLKLPLIIIGIGPEYRNLKSKITDDKLIKLLGFIQDSDLSDYYSNCKAFIMPQEEDFGITPVEAMSFGKPVLALRRGGSIETVIEGKTGEFFDDPIPEGLADGIRRLNNNYSGYDPEFIRSHADKFSSARFRKEVLELITK
jgi:glycosyltransferase involved in cell wall biosynthesis